jgi:hypothetical protein
MPDISTPNLDYGNMVEAWDINDALMGGTLYMRQLGSISPRWPKEDKEDYKNASPWPRFCQPTKRPLSKTSGVYSPSLLSLPRMCLISCESMRKLRPGGDAPGCMGAGILRSGDAVWPLPRAGGLSRVDTEKVKTKAEESYRRAPMSPCSIHAR